MSMTNEYLKKDIYLQKKDRKLLTIWDWYNSIIMEYQKIINFSHNAPNQLNQINLGQKNRLK